MLETLTLKKLVKKTLLLTDVSVKKILLIFIVDSKTGNFLGKTTLFIISLESIFYSYDINLDKLKGI